jgi:hypothetical protein
MRWLFVIVAVTLLGCEAQPAVTIPAYEPHRFRSHVEKLIAKKDYAAAVIYLESASPEKQARHDVTGFLAIGEDLIFLPGISPPEAFDGGRDWCFPGTQDAIEHDEWQRAATQFALEYNRARERFSVRR